MYALFFQKIACKLGRIYVNGKQMLDVDYVLKNGDSIHHWGHRHEHPVRFNSFLLLIFLILGTILWLYD
ncbi:hypothetical protein Y032_0082g1547 [Ancylostoma ceylanicum]|uniref:RNA-binding S4 domain-containing protein n=1 Tax=Ancylostoma ceylanicum TaxID=53326 RepID=A0A016TRV2_9BILA|nr:hypothetical protein Y032_0082g1547 [Ancylostoma ceylanicum]